MKIDTPLILKLERLARLELSTDEREDIKGDLNKILSMFDKMQELDTDNVEPLIYMTDEVQELRADDVHQPVSQTEILKNAPNHDGTFVKVPKMINK